MSSISSSLFENQFDWNNLAPSDPLFCLHCRDIFPASQLREGEYFGLQACGSKRSNCDAEGFGFDIHYALGEFALGVLEQNNDTFSAAVARGTIEGE